MAKLATINREQKRRDLVAKYAKKRAALEAIIADSKAGEEAHADARAKLQALPRNSNPTRLRNRQVKGCVNATVAVNLPRQCVDIGVFELRHFAVLADQVDDRMQGAEFVELTGRRAVAGLAFFDALPKWIKSFSFSEFFTIPLPPRVLLK